jgi:tetratricopeptide (TPR) repeat protein
MLSIFNRAIIGPVLFSNKDSLKLTVKAGIIAFSLTCIPNASFSQGLSADDLSLMIDQRVAITNPYEALLNDPDPMRSAAAFEIMIASQDDTLARLAIEFGLESGRPETRQLAAAAAYKNWNDLSGLSLNIQRKAEIVASLTTAGQFAEATEIAEASLQQVQADSHDLSAVELTNNLAFLYATMGRIAEAEPLFSSVLNNFEANLGNDHRQTITAQNNLAVLYSQAGRLSDAEALFQSSLASQIRTLGEHHPDTLVSMGNLASLYEEQGRFDEATSLYQQTLETSENVLGANHPETALIRSKLVEAISSRPDENGEEQ